jgi:hypothetical protein
MYRTPASRRSNTSLPTAGKEGGQRRDGQELGLALLDHAFDQLMVGGALGLALRAADGDVAEDDDDMSRVLRSSLQLRQRGQDDDKLA